MLFQGPTNEETLEAKNEREKTFHGKSHSVQVCRADNSRFNANLFVEDCSLANQKLTFCGTGAHHQNGIGEATNKRTTEYFRKCCYMLR